MEPLKPARTVGVMNWQERIDYLVGKGRISRVAIFGIGGKPLAGTTGLHIPDLDIVALCECVDLPLNVYNRSNFGLFIGQVQYLCLKVNANTLLGISKEDLFVAHRCDNVLILAFVPMLTDTTVSCLSEVWTFSEELKSHIEVSHLVQ